MIWNQKSYLRSMSIKPKIDGDFNSANKHFCQNLEMLILIGGGLWHGQLKIGTFWHWRWASIVAQELGSSSKSFSTSDLNLLIVAITHDELLFSMCTISWLTYPHTHTDAGNDNTQRPKLAMVNRIHDEIIHTLTLGMDTLFHPALYWANDYLYILALILIHKQ